VATFAFPFVAFEVLLATMAGLGGTSESSGLSSGLSDPSGLSGIHERGFDHFANRLQDPQ
jgi:hypothetical protein